MLGKDYGHTELFTQSYCEQAARYGDVGVD
jgi:hypothetical protein